ncbi:DNA helicase [Pseudooceanicola sp.]|uniref:DNA helicase n=1 Tax=Pseudooceanicola sp. TaxID=1914328 RepID=UPI0035C68CFA
MHLTTPLYRLKRQAKRLARQDAIPLHQALDRTAAGIGFRSWSHLSAAATATSPAAQLLTRLSPGDMVLMAARPGQGKTLLALEMAARAGEIGRAGAVFSLDYHEAEVTARLAELGVAKAAPIHLDTSDEIDADHIIRWLAGTDGKVVLAVDYMQLLDQRRSTPALQPQVTALRRAVKDHGAICLMLSQVHRAFDLSVKAMPGPADIRLPNPLDLGLFDRCCFLHDGRITLDGPNTG